MMSKKKRSALDDMGDVSEPAIKKMKKSDDDGDGVDIENAGTSEATNQQLDGAQNEVAKPAAVEKVKVKVKEEPKETVVPKTEYEYEEPAPAPMVANDDIPDWPEADLLELMKRMEKEIPQKDNLRYESRVERLNWKGISFGNYSADQCKEMWCKIQKRLRRYRLLRELLEDGKSWVSKPWTNFYRSQKQNRHPDMPRRPLTTYMLYFLEKKDRVAQENPGLEMTGVSKMIAERYKTLPMKKKQKYMDMAARQRQEYEQKMEEFYFEHPELVPKPVPHKEHKSTTEIGPKKPRTPFKLFFEDREKKLKDEPDFNRAELLENCKDQWKNMSDKKKVVWINWALEEEAKYEEQLKAYMCENPNFVPTITKTILTKEEQHIRERAAGKPEKPPNSGYSLFTRIMLVSPEIKQIVPKERMSKISKMWSNLGEIDKKKYQDQVNHMIDQYRMEYANYLDSLPEDRRQEELQNSQTKRKAASKADIAKKNAASQPKVLQKGKAVNKDKQLFKGEPEPPPMSAFQLFMQSFVPDSNLEEEAHQCWQTLSETEKASYKKQLNELKEKYIKDYESFLRSLSQEELKEYSRQKKGVKQEVESSEESEDENESKNNVQASASNNDSSSDSDSESSDSSESDEGSLYKASEGSSSDSD